MHTRIYAIDCNACRVCDREPAEPSVDQKLEYVEQAVLAALAAADALTGRLGAPWLETNRKSVSNLLGTAATRIADLRKRCETDVAPTIETLGEA